MTTYAQWRSPSSRPETGSYSQPRKYDIRVVDQFYSYCQAVSMTDQQRAAAARSQEAMKLNLWKSIIAGSLVCYYLVERVAQAMSLY
jgi:predicted nucleic acid-binding protein